MRFSDFRLSTRIVLATLLAIIVAGGLALLMARVHLYDAYVVQRDVALQQRLLSETNRFNREIDTLRRDALFLSNIPPVSGIVRATLNYGYDARYRNTHKVWEERMQQIFAAFALAHPGYYQIRFIGVADGGREIVRIDQRHEKIEATPFAQLQAQGDRDYYKATLQLHEGEVYLSEFNLNQEQEQIERPYRPTLRAAVPIYAPTGKVFGLIVINMAAGSLIEAARAELPAGTQAYLANQAGHYLLHPDLQRAFEFELGNTRAIQTELPALKALFEPQALANDFQPLFITHTGGQLLEASRIHFDPAHPERFLLLAYHVPAAEMAVLFPGLSVSVIAASLFMLALVGGLALLVLRRTLAPLEKLATSATQIANGTRTHWQPSGGKDEIGRLSSAFAAMLEKLFAQEQAIRKINEGLESQVVERSNELNASKRRLSEIIKLLPLGIWIVDKNGNLEFENEVGRKILKGCGYKCTEPLGIDYCRWSANSKLIEPHKLAAARAIKKGENSPKEEIEIECCDGTCKLIASYALPLRENDGNLTGAIVVSEDITERKRAELVLKQHKQMLDTTTEGFWTTDDLGYLLEANVAYADMSGYSLDELMSMHMSQLESPVTTVEQFQARLANIISRGHDRFEACHRHKDGHDIEVEISVTHVSEIGRFIFFCHDISERKKIEQAKLRENDLRFRGTLEQVAVGIVHTSLDGHFEKVNQRFCDILGYERHELMQMSFEDITHLDDFQAQIHYREQMLAGEISHFSIEKRCVRKDHTFLWANLTVSLLRDDDGVPVFFIGVVEDIAERKNAELLAQQFGHLLQGSFNEIYLFDALTLQFLLTSTGAERNLGYSDEELGQFTLLDLAPSFTWKNFEQQVAQLRSGEQQSLFLEASLQRKDGSSYLVEARLQLMEADFPVFIMVAQDVTERRQADNEINRSRKLLRSLLVQIESLREEERKHIARELHDELGQILTALRMNIALLRMDFGERYGEPPENLKQTMELLDMAIACTRNVVTSLRPAALDMGIVHAVRWLRDEFVKRTGVICILHEPEHEIQLDEITAVSAFRIVQESLTNVARYAEASKVEITLRQSADTFSIIVTDNGIGFDCSDVASFNSFGLLGMRERAIALAGVVNISSTLQQGTQVFFEVPCKYSIIDMKGGDS